METSENWITKDGYSLVINHLHRSTIAGNLQLILNDQVLKIPFEAFINIHNPKQLEFCFFVDWNLYVTNGSCYSSFIGKSHIKENTKYLFLEWLLVFECTEPNTQILTIKGNNELVKASMIDIRPFFLNNRNNVPFPFFIKSIKTQVNIAKSKIQ